jgi:hypothetical protein
MCDPHSSYAIKMQVGINSLYGLQLIARHEFQLLALLIILEFDLFRFHNANICPHDQALADRHSIGTEETVKFIRRFVSHVASSPSTLSDRDVANHLVSRESAETLGVAVVLLYLQVRALQKLTTSVATISFVLACSTVDCTLLYSTVLC